MKVSLSSILRILLPAIVAACAAACSSGRSSEFELSREDYAVNPDTEQQTETVYLEGTLPIDQVDSKTLRADVWKIDDTHYPDSVHAFVRVLDSQNNFVTRMGPPHFRGADAYQTHWREVREELSYFDAYRNIHKVDDFVVREYSDGDSIPFAISLVLDHGGSMGGAIDALIDGSKIFVSMKRSYDRMAILTFSNTPDVIAEITNNKRVLNDALDEKGGLDEQGRYTALYDAALAGIKQIDDEPAGSPRVLVIFTDGEDNYSREDAQAVYDLAVKNEVSVYPIGFGYTNDDVLGELARRTGGKFYKAYSRDELLAIFRDLYLSLRNYYRVSWVPPNKPLLHEVTVTVDAPGRDIPMLAMGEYDRTIGDEIANRFIRVEQSQDIIADYRREREDIAANQDDRFADNRGDDSNGDKRDGDNSNGDNRDGDNGDNRGDNGNSDDGDNGDNDSTMPEHDQAQFEVDLANKFDQTTRSGRQETFDLPDNLFFDVGEDKLRPEAFVVLRSIANSLKGSEGVRLRIVGHTDNTWVAAGSKKEIERLNLLLSRRRAKAVEGFLVKEGVDRDRLQSLGRGMSQPVANNDTEEGRARNRRVEFVIIRQ